MATTIMMRGIGGNVSMVAAGSHCVQVVESAIAERRTTLELSHRLLSEVQ
jgi:hypothetical protein